MGDAQTAVRGDFLGGGASRRRAATSRTTRRNDSTDFDDAWTRAFVAKRVVSCVSGDGTLPKALGAAVDAMSRRRARRRAGLALGGGGGDIRGEDDVVLVVSRASASAAMDGVEYRVELISMVHVRDVFGDGFVAKRREREGFGEFPADCPLKDCRVRVHFRARLITNDETHETRKTETRHQREYAYDTRLDASLGGAAFSFRLGCGRAPLALETSIRLMIPGETSRVTLTPASHERYGYSGLRRREESPGWTALSAALSAAGPDAGLELSWSWRVRRAGELARGGARRARSPL